MSENPSRFLQLDDPAFRERLASAIRDASVNGKLPCRRAFSLAGEMGVPIAVVGFLADEIDVRIAGCQLGCFP